MSEFEHEYYDDKQEDQDNAQQNNDDIQDRSTDISGSNMEKNEDSLYRYVGDPYQKKDSYETSGIETGMSENRESHRYSYREQKEEEQENDGAEHTYYSNIPEEPKKRGRKGNASSGSMAKSFVKLVGAALIFGVVAGLTIAGISVLKNKMYPTTSSRIETTIAPDSEKEDTSSDSAEAGGASASAITDSDVSGIVSEVMPSVVSITSTIQTSSYYGFGTQESEGAGSGFIIAKTDDALMIATNNHVVANSTKLTVGFIDNTTVPATIVGTDSNADLAVISVKLSDVSEDTASKIKIAVLGDSDNLKVGETVVAIGNALGYGQSVTTGVLSAKDREVSFTDGTMTLLQTDAAINPGNSGGVLINLKGEVIGINNAKLEDTSVEGMCYAIPMSTAKTVLDDLMNAGSITEEEAAYLGIVGKTIDSTYSQALGMPSGIYVTQVVSGSPAEKAGISAGDIITGFEGNNVSTMDGLKQKLSLKKADTKVEITLKRANQNGEYKEKTVKVTLGKKSDYADATEDSTQTTESGNNSGNNGNNGNGGNINPFDYFYGNGNGSSGGSSSPYYYYYNN